MAMIASPDCESVWCAFREVARAVPDRPFLCAPPAHTGNGQARHYSYAEAQSTCVDLAAGFKALGVKQGDRVALALDNGVDVYLYLLALNALAASLLPLNMAATDSELRYFIEHSDARLVVVAPGFCDRLNAIVAPLDDCELCTVAALSQGSSEDLQFADDTIAAGETEAALLYTSGTTGQPKGCMLSNDYFLTLGRWYNGLGGRFELACHDRLLTPLPPNHMNALCTSFMGMLLCGGCIIQLDRFHPGNWWQTVRDQRASIIHYLGVMPAILMQLPQVNEEDFSEQIRFAFGAGVDPRHHAAFERRFGFPLIEGWAMTETGAGGLTATNEEPRHVGERSIGRPVDTMEYRIVDEQDVDVAAGEAGELLVRSAGQHPRTGYFSGYYKDPEATEYGWRGGWWHTGDVVRSGPDDLLLFVDRRKNVIRRSGENIAAVEVETVLLEHPAVANCAVTAVPDDIRGDEVFSFVVAASQSADAELAAAIVTHCLQRLSYFKAPGYIAFVDELPLTASQKVARGEVRNRARVSLERGECVDLRGMKRAGRRPA